MRLYTKKVIDVAVINLVTTTRHARKGDHLTSARNEKAANQVANPFGELISGVFRDDLVGNTCQREELVGYGENR